MNPSQGHGALTESTVEATAASRNVNLSRSEEEVVVALRLRLSALLVGLGE